MPPRVGSSQRAVRNLRSCLPPTAFCDAQRIRISRAVRIKLSRRSGSAAACGALTQRIANVHEGVGRAGRNTHTATIKSVYAHVRLL